MIGSSGSSGGGHDGSSSDYIGCLAYSDSALDDMWIFPGQRPNCEYAHHDDDDYDDGNGGGDNSNGNDGSGGQGGEDQSNGDHQDANDENQQDNGNNQNDQQNDGNQQDSEGDNQDNGNQQDAGDNQENGNQQGQDDQEGRDNYEEVVDNNDFSNYYEEDDYQGDQYDNGNDQGQHDLDPYADFDITQCNTYENLWLWDFSITCESEDSLENCQCLFAEQLLQLGLLSCDDAPSCPSECRVCESCMRLLGCEVAAGKSKFTSSGNYIFVIAAAVGLLIFGGIVMARRRRANGSSSLNAYLMEDDGSDVPTPTPSSTPQGIFLAPDGPVTQFGPSLAAGGVDAGEASSNDDDVWLAPVS